MKKILLISAALFAATVVSAQQQMPKIPVDPAVRIGHLDNGLTYYIRHHEEPKGQANFYIAQKVGSILEEENQRGLAHFLEHMCFNGTQHFPGNGVIKYCESIGVKFGYNLNAYTSIDETVYNIDNVPVATVPSAVDSCLMILHDWADGLLLTGEDIDHERGVIHEEWRRSANSATMRMYEKILPEIYPGNRYGVRLPIGLMSVVDNFPYKALRDYYEKWYRPDQQGIIVVGDVNVDEIEAKIKNIFGTIAKPVNPAERYYVQVEDNKEPIVSICSDKEQSNALIYIFKKHEAFPDQAKGDLNYLVYSYAKYAAQKMMESRIQEILQKEGQPFIQAGVDDEDFFLSKTKGSWCGFATTSAENVKAAIPMLYREMLRASRNGFTASEYERAKAEILSEYETAYKQRDKKKSGEYCREYVRHFIDNEPIAGEENMFTLAQQLAPNIPVDVVNKIVASFVGEGNLVLAAMLPQKEGVTYPSAEEVKGVLAAVEAEKIEPYVDAVSDEPLVKEVRAAGKISKTEDSKFGFRKYTLSNGATVYLKTTDFNADEIKMTAFSNGGTSLYPESDAATLKAVSQLMTIGGVGAFDKIGLQKALSGRQVSVNPYISTFQEGVYAKSTPKDLETMFQLNYLYFTSQRRDDKAFEAWKSRQRPVIANRNVQPMSALQDTLTNTIIVNPARISSMTIAELEGVNYKKAMQIAGERFADASDFTFIFCGNVDEKTLLPLVEKYIASLPSTYRDEKANAKAIEYRKGFKANVFDRNAETDMVTNCFYGYGKVNYNLKNSLSFDIALNCLTTTLLEEIREKEGGTYSIGAYGDMSSYPRKEAVYQIVYQTNPDKYEYLNGRVRFIVSSFCQNGPSAENIDKAKKYFLKNFKEDQKENDTWINYIQNYVLVGADLHTGYEKTLESISANDIRKALADINAQGNNSEVIMRSGPAYK